MEKLTAITVGITGHRVVNDPKAVKEAITKILSIIRPNSENQALTMISPLAEGVDRLAAEAILESEGTSSAKNSFLQVVLPMPKDDYKKDFKTQESKDEFDFLLNKASEKMEMELLNPKNASYEAVGHHVVDNCDVMIAVWNGKPPRGRGGTAEIIDYANAKKVPLYWIDSESPSEIFRTFVESDRQRLTQLGSWGKGFIESMDHQSKIFHHLDVLDEIILRFEMVVGHFKASNKKASDNAKEFQKKYRDSSKWIYSLAVIAVLIVSAQSIFHLNHWIILGEVFAISAILMIFWRSRKKRWHAEWIENRLEAEWLRISVYAAFLRGITKDEFSNHWAIRWVKDEKCTKRVQKERNVLSGPKKLSVYTPYSPTSTTAASMEESRLALLKNYMGHSWLIAQRNYHQAKAKNEESNENKIYIPTQIMFWTTFFVALLHLIPHSAYHSFNLPEDPIVRVLTLLAIGLPTIGAALTGLESHFEYSKISRRSTYMVDHLSELEAQLVGVKTIDELSKLVDETENLMLQENSDWFFMIGTHKITTG